MQFAWYGFLFISSKHRLLIMIVAVHYGLGRHIILAKSPVHMAQVRHSLSSSIQGDFTDRVLDLSAFWLLNASTASL